ncbi:MAG: P-loop NTPase family protein [Nitrososphaerales archaeon]
MNAQARERAILVSSIVKPALQLRGLTFGNRIDELLRGGLIPKTFTFLYGKSANTTLNTLCANALHIFGGKVIFIDAANSFDPYKIVQQQALKSEKQAQKFITSIVVSRAFTCYQLRKLITSNLINEVYSKENEIHSIFVSGLNDLFNEEDNTKTEIMRLELLMVSSLRRIASDKKNKVMFVVVSSKMRSEHLVTKADTVIKLFFEGNKKKQIERAILMKHYIRQFETIDL